MTMQTINSKLSAYAETVNFIDELKKEAETLKAEILAFMESQNLTELNGTEHKATYKTIISKRFDSKALEKVNPALYNEFVKETETKRFNFK